MKASGKIGSNGVYVSDNVEKSFGTNVHKYIHTYIHYLSIQRQLFLFITTLSSHPSKVGLLILEHSTGTVQKFDMNTL
jgi:hypothetical protein